MAKVIGGSNNSIILFCSLIIGIIYNLDRWKTTSKYSTQGVLLVGAFSAPGGGFGGGGGGFSSGKNTKKNTNRKAKTNTRKKRSGLAEMTNTIKENKKKDKSISTGSLKSPHIQQPQLDKWGLPFTTLEDIFPILSEDTELDPIDSSKDHYKLSEIQDSLKDHVDLGDMSSNFDEMGFAKVSNVDGTIPRLRLLHQSPPVLSLGNFLTEGECRDTRSVATNADKASTIAYRVDSTTFTGALSTRTSTSWFCRYDNLPVLLAKAHHLLGVPLETMEEPQIVRYKGGEEFSWHYDEVPKSQLSNGGQRLATLLVYLTDVPPSKGGGTIFRDLKESSSSSSPLVMQPQMGSALLFFPSFRDESPDDRTLHKSEVLIGDDSENNKNNDDNDYKWIVQMWTHQRNYKATLPMGNSNENARDIVEATGKKLGFTDIDSVPRR